MGTLQNLSNESFSSSWLTTTRTSFEYKPNAYDFDFHVPSSHSSLLVPADQIFSNGLLLPLQHVSPSKIKMSSESSDTALLNSSSSESFEYSSNRIFQSVPSTPISHGAKFKLPFLSLRNCRNYFCFLSPFGRKEKRLRLMPRRTGKNSPTMHRPFVGSEDEFETSIQEAVVHCKNSVAQGAQWMVAKENNWSNEEIK